MYLKVCDKQPVHTVASTPSLSLSTQTEMSVPSLNRASQPTTLTSTSSILTQETSSTLTPQGDLIKRGISEDSGMSSLSPNVHLNQDNPSFPLSFVSVGEDYVIALPSYVIITNHNLYKYGAANWNETITLLDF